MFVSFQGSTEDLLKELSSKESPAKIKSIIMSRRFGQHKWIAFKHSAGEVVVIMDVDGQDPVSIIPKMIEKWNEGYDVVYGKRLKREK